MHQWDLAPSRVPWADLSPSDQAFVLALAVLVQGKVPAPEGVS